MTGKKIKLNSFLPRIEQDIRNSLQCCKHSSGFIVALLQQSRYWADACEIPQ